MIQNKRSRKTINLNKPYRAVTRFIQNEQGNLEQNTVLYEDNNGSQKQPVFQTKHCKVQVTKTSLLLDFKFPRKKLPTHAIEAYVYDETNMITDFISSDVGQKAIDTAEKEILKLEAERGK